MFSVSITQKSKQDHENCYSDNEIKKELFTILHPVSTETYLTSPRKNLIPLSSQKFKMNHRNFTYNDEEFVANSSSRSKFNKKNIFLTLNSDRYNQLNEFKESSFKETSRALNDKNILNKNESSMLLISNHLSLKTDRNYMEKTLKSNNHPLEHEKIQEDLQNVKNAKKVSNIINKNINFQNKKLTSELEALINKSETRSNRVKLPRIQSTSQKDLNSSSLKVSVSLQRIPLAFHKKQYNVKTKAESSRSESIPRVIAHKYLYSNDDQAENNPRMKCGVIQSSIDRHCLDTFNPTIDSDLNDKKRFEIRVKNAQKIISFNLFRPRTIKNLRLKNKLILREYE